MTRKRFLVPKLEKLTVEELTGHDKFGAIYTTAEEIRDARRPSRSTMNYLLKVAKGVAYSIKANAYESASEIARLCMHGSPLGDLMRNMSFEDHCALVEQELTTILESMLDGKSPRKRNLQLACVLRPEERSLSIGLKCGQNEFSQGYRLSRGYKKLDASYA